MLSPQEVNCFAATFRLAKLNGGIIPFGSFYLKAHRVMKPVFVNQDKLNFRHQYSLVLNNTRVTFCIQLYLNTNNSGNKQHRLSCFSIAYGIKGLIFTINLSKQKDAKGQIFLTSKLTFTQQPQGNSELAKAHRRAKQQVFSEILRRLDFDITDNNDILLGIFDTKRKVFLNTNRNRLLEDLLAIAVLKGHFMANKGYQLELLPLFDKSFHTQALKQQEQDSPDESIILPPQIEIARSRRTIPLSLRFKVLHRDRSTCATCGKNQLDGVKLHIDHIIPFSRGGLTILSNLRTLCSECNIGRSNRYLD